ncbi:CD209 antigen-like protein E [Xyrauchen texanus]|uniref:CD209 antigen-like protein E n=1 Tax=Xyrauchen texanus TaxID=154827 RepID=UPI00224189F7|nr:CD209 antigen-like protein E [Xyrauchen texanus]
MELEDIYEDAENENSKSSKRSLDRDEDVIDDEETDAHQKWTFSQIKRKDRNRRGSVRCVLSTVCFGLFYALLFTVNIVLRTRITADTDLLKMRYKNTVYEYNKCTEMFHVNYSNLTSEKDPFQNSYKSLMQKNLELETRIKSLSDELKNKHSERVKSNGWHSFFISSEEKSWSDSRQFCRDRGGDLIIINTEEKQRFISSFKERAWIGLSDIENKGNMKWVDSSTLNKGFWDKNEPNDNFGNENCVEMLPLKPILSNWNDLQCSELRTWICEN